MKLGFILSKKIDYLSKKAEHLLNKSKSREAIIIYNKIIELLPEPKEMWEAYEWVNIAIADTYFLAKDYENANLYFNRVIDDSSNPYVFLRYGQVKYYINDVENAQEYLLKAYKMAGKDIFNDEDKIFLEIAQKYNKIKFENLFRLPLEYQYLEKEYMGYQSLWSAQIDWSKIYQLYSSFFEKIPVQLYSNSISFLCASATLEAAIHLKKSDVFSKWLDNIELTSKTRMDHRVVEVWQGICELSKDNKKGALDYFKKAEKKGTDRILKDFRHFGNDIYNFYTENV